MKKSSTNITALEGDVSKVDWLFKLPDPDVKRGQRNWFDFSLWRCVKTPLNLVTSARFLLILNTVHSALDDMCVFYPISWDLVSSSLQSKYHIYWKNVSNLDSTKITKTAIETESWSERNLNIELVFTIWWSERADRGESQLTLNKNNNISYLPYDAWCK